MERTYNINYNQIITLVHKLSFKDKKKLAVAIQSELESEKPSKKLQELLLKGPVWSENDYNDFLTARDYFNKSRIA